MATSQESSSGTAVDPVDALVIAVLERLTSGDAGALDQICAANPELADSIRTRVAALGDMNLLPNDAAAMAFPERLGDFRLVRRLGGGGMGVVYEAVQQSLGRTVALKLIRPEHLYFERSRERFQREIEAVARLAHPSIVSIYTVGEAQGTPYFAMEMIRGATLAQALEQFAGLAPESLVGSDLNAAAQSFATDEVGATSEHSPDLFDGTWAQTSARIIVRMTEALEHAHGRGVLHRDIKPSNIAVTPDGRVVLLDFGLAELEHELRLTGTGSALGSMLYMAPEQIAARAHEIDARTDVYSLGVTLYELLTLHAPYGGSDSEQTRSAILDGQPQPVRSRHRGVPRDLEIVCLKAMERERSRRYASMAAFGADLRNALEGRAIQARPPSAAYRARRWMLRHPTTTTAAVLGTLLVTGLPFSLYLQQRASSKTLERALEAETRARKLAAEEGARANAKAQEAEQVAAFLVDLYGAADPYSEGRRDVTAREVLDAGVARIDAELSNQPEVQAVLFERIGMSYTNLDLYEQAIAPLQRAVQLRHELHGDADARTAATKVQLASALRLAGRPGAVEILTDVHDVLDRIDTDVATAVNVCTLLAVSLLDQGDVERPRELIEEARARLDEHEGEHLDLQWLVLSMQATVNNRVGRFAEAEASARAALALPPLPDHKATPWRVAALDCLANALTRQGRLEEAARVYDELLPEARGFYPEDNVVRVQMELDAAHVRARLGIDDEYAAAAERAFDVMRRSLGLTNRKTLNALSQLSDAWLRAGRFDDARRVLDEVVGEIEDSAGPKAPSLLSPLQFAGAQALARGDRATAETTLRRARELALEIEPGGRVALDVTLARVLVADPSQRAEAGELARANLEAHDLAAAVAAHWVLARIALAEQRTADAESQLRRALEIEAPTNAWPPAACRELLAEILLARGDVDQGCPMLTAALATLERELGARHADVTDARERAAASGFTATCASRSR